MVMMISQFICILSNSKTKGNVMDDFLLQGVVTGVTVVVMCWRVYFASVIIFRARSDKRAVLWSK